MRPLVLLTVLTLLALSLAGCEDIAFLDTLEKLVLGYKWTLVTDAAQWGPRRAHSTVVYDGKIWVIGGASGADPATFLNDVWSSADGRSWTEVTDAAGWGKRSLHTSVVYDGKMWVIGGYQEDSGSAIPADDVWYSTNGSDWTEAVTSAPSWSARFLQVSLVYDNKMWVIGGRDNSSSFYDAWSSTNGTDWLEAPAALPVAYPTGMAGTVFDGKMWLLAGWEGSGGGNDSNEVWYSTDGTTWTAAPAAPWPDRASPAAVVYDDQLWIIGGKYDPTGNNYNDVWHTADGASWSEFRGAVPWSKRRGHTCAVFNGTIFMMGGWDGTTPTDEVWSFGR